jgi:hypothetical protein
MVCCVTQPIGKSPECFVREFGEHITDYDIFQDPNHNEFQVHVINKSMELYFKDGWVGLASRMFMTYVLVPELLLLMYSPLDYLIFLVDEQC